MSVTPAVRCPKCGGTVFHEIGRAEANSFRRLRARVREHRRGGAVSDLEDPSGFVGVDGWARTLHLRDSGYGTYGPRWQFLSEEQQERWREVAREEIADGRGPIQPGRQR